MEKNAFAAEAAKARRSMEATAAKAVAKKKGAGACGEPSARLRCVSIRLPEEVWRWASMRRIETGESMNALITRLLEEEMGEA